MISYKDMTFCSATECRNARCFRRWTDTQKRAADKWAKDSGLSETPVSMADFSKGCLGHFTSVTTNSFGDTVLLDGDEVVAVLNKPELDHATLSKNSTSS